MSFNQKFLLRTEPKSIWNYYLIKHTYSSPRQWIENGCKFYARTDVIAGCRSNYAGPRHAVAAVVLNHTNGISSFHVWLWRRKSFRSFFHGANESRLKFRSKSSGGKLFARRPSLKWFCVNASRSFGSEDMGVSGKKIRDCSANQNVVMRLLQWAFVFPENHKNFLGALDEPFTHTSTPTWWGALGWLSFQAWFLWAIWLL